MFLLTAAAIAISSPPTRTSASGICEVGRAALRDLPLTDHNHGYARYYGDAGIAMPDLLDACPDLRRFVPGAFPMADPTALAQSRVGAPIPGQPTPLTMVFEVGVPVIAVDGKSATVAMAYGCTGLCGARFEARYVRDRSGWRRVGDIRIVSVS